jgi:hypothetical protein
LAIVNCLSPDTEKFLEGKVSNCIRVEVYSPGRVTGR